jgi:hypothetical protein
MKLTKPTHAGYFCGQSVIDLAQRLRAGSLTSVELTEAALDSIERLNPILNAFVCVDAAVALAQASKADELFEQGLDLGRCRVFRSRSKTTSIRSTMSPLTVRHTSPVSNPSAMRCACSVCVRPAQ